MNSFDQDAMRFQDLDKAMQEKIGRMHDHGPESYDVLMLAQGLFDAEGRFRELHEDQASYFLERLDAVLCKI